MFHKYLVKKKTGAYKSAEREFNIHFISLCARKPTNWVPTMILKTALQLDKRYNKVVDMI